MKYIISPIIYLVWYLIVEIRDFFLLIGVVLWYFDSKKLTEFLDSRVPLLFTHHETLKYRGFQIVPVVFGYASLSDYMERKVSYYYIDGTTPRLGKVGDLHWQHCQFSEPRS